MLRTTGVIAIILGALTATPIARADSGLYLSATGGAVFPSDTNSNIGTRLSYDTGYSALAALGLGILIARVEIEAGYRQADVARATVAGVGLPAGGDTRMISGMVNGYIDIPFSLLGFKPYIGAGLGAARVDLSHVTAAGAPLLDGHQTVLAFQGMAGLSYALASHVTLTLGYRFFGTDNVQVRSQSGATSVSVKQDGLRTQSAELGLRLTF
jgi:opacity protein-like surface antigen